MNLRYQPSLAPQVDVVEAYLSYRSAPSAAVKLSARAGAFFPPASLEHDDLLWSTIHTITPSAINSWITEEVRVVGLEVAGRTHLASQPLTITGAVFGDNDTAGTALAFRGWALHDLKGGLASRLPLAPISPARQMLFPTQARDTIPRREVDGRAGYYAKVEWRSPKVTMNLLRYDNGGDRVSVNNGQYAWETRFTSLGLKAQVAPTLTVLAQAMAGRTRMGPLLPPVVVDASFASAYLMAVVDMGRNSLAGRVEAFGVDDHSFAIDDQDEHGWAATLAMTHVFAPQWQGRLELMRVSDDRMMRADAGVDARQTQIQAQGALRFSF